MFVLTAKFPGYKLPFFLHSNYSGRAWAKGQQKAERFTTREQAEKVAADQFIVRGSTWVKIVQV